MAIFRDIAPKTVRSHRAREGQAVGQSAITCFPFHLLPHTARSEMPLRAHLPSCHAAFNFDLLSVSLTMLTQHITVANEGLVFLAGCCRRPAFLALCDGTLALCAAHGYFSIRTYVRDHS